MSEDDLPEEYFCPICKDIMIFPRVYNCGHTICERCMKHADDKAYEENEIFSLPVFKCPICRKFEFTRWFNRPINYNLISILNSHIKDYEKKIEDYEKQGVNETIIKIPERVNLSFVCLQKRVELCQDIYEKIIPHLYEAANNGKPFVVITIDNTKIDVIADILSKKLFEENGVYKIMRRSDELVIDFISHKNLGGTNYWEYINNNYDPNFPETVEPEFSPLRVEDDSPNTIEASTRMRQIFNNWRQDESSS